MLLKSREDSTAKRYVGDIRAFLKWCRLNNIEVAIPVSAATAAIYMFQLVQKQISAVTLVPIRAALKWFHSFTQSGGPNPLDDSLCTNIIEKTKRNRHSPIVKKTPLTADIIKSVIVAHAYEGASLKDLRIATLCTLGFAGFFVSRNSVMFKQTT